MSGGQLIDATIDSPSNFRTPLRLQHPLSYAGIAAYYVQRMMAHARGDAEYIDVHFESATILRKHILRAQQDNDYALVAAYAEGALTMGLGDLIR